ncbi:MAG: dephospho-CoA kinase [Planctomycetaceae bacterium]|nr:dephospho-CoA kinase [Planctomycetaceae bacterium]
MAHKHKPNIGIVGGVGSGKSAVARWLADEYHGLLIDADAVGHQVLLRDDVKARLRDVFGDEIFVDGEIARSRLAGHVFGDDPERVVARKRLESIVHPVMGEVFKRELKAGAEDPSVQMMIIDAAILLEAGWRDGCDVLAFVDVPREQRLQRVAESRGWSEDELAGREASQWPLDRKRELSDVVIDNSGTIEQAGQQLADYLFREDWVSSEPSHNIVSTS